MKHILFISYDGMTDPLGQSQVIPYLSALTREGYRFTILSCDKAEKYRDNKTYVEKLLDSFPIRWVSIPYHKNPPVFSSVYDFFKLRNRAMSIFRESPFQMIHTRVGLPTLVALWMKKKTGVKFLNDIRGFWADERVDGGMWNLKNPLYRIIYRFFKKHEYECLEKADFNTCLTFAGRKEIQSWKNIPKQPIPVEVIPCSADLALFNPNDLDKNLQDSLKAELGIVPGDFVISYLGSIGGWYMTKDMMQFCGMLLQKRPETKFLFISPHRHEDIMQAANEFSIPSENIITRKGQRHEVPALLSLSSYSLFFIKPCYSKKSSSPTKHGEIMAMGIPVITNAGVGDVEEIVTRYNAGIIIQELNEKNYLYAIDTICSGITFDQNVIRAGAKDFYSLDKAVEKYKNVYKIILDGD